MCLGPTLNPLNAHLLHTRRLWNDLPDNIQNASSVYNFKQLLYLDDNKPNAAYYYGQRWPSVHHAWSRIGCSGLNDDLSSNLHVIPSPACHCGFPVEKAQHYFYHCPNYQVERVILLNSIQHIPDLSVKTMLFGTPQLSLRDNHELFQAVPGGRPHLYNDHKEISLDRGW